MVADETEQPFVNIKLSHITTLNLERFQKNESDLKNVVINETHHVIDVELENEHETAF